MAVAHLLVHAIYFVLSAGEEYRENKPKELNEIQRHRIIRHHTRQLHRLGCWLPTEKLTPLKECYITHLFITRPKVRTSDLDYPCNVSQLYQMNGEDLHDP